MCSAVTVNSMIFLLKTGVKNVNRHAIIIISVSIAALTLGFAVAYPLLIADYPSMAEVELSVDVMYVYITPVGSDSNLTGLCWNNTIVDLNYEADGLAVSYLAVLNVTNHSNESVRINGFDFIVGPQVSVAYKGGGVSSINPIITYLRNYEYIPAEDFVWEPQTSRLIQLSGVTGVHEIPYESLNSDVFLYGNVNGQIAYGGGGRFTVNYSLKQVQFQTVENAYLYNVLVDENQILLFYRDFEVTVATRR